VNRPLDWSGRQPEEPDAQGEKLIWGTTVNVKKVRDRIRDFFSNTTSRQHASSSSIRDKYESLIEEALETRESVNLDCKDLMAVDQHLYQQLVLYPVEVIECFDIEACEIAKHIVALSGVSAGPNLDVLQEAALAIRVRPFNLRRLHVMRDLNPSDIDQLVSFRGMIIRAAPIIPDLQIAFFECNVCRFTTTVELDKGRITEPSLCLNCRTQGSMIIIHNRCSFNDRQLVRCQESPGDIPQGETPHTVNLCAFDELVDKAKPGDRVQITGIYRAVPTRLKATQRSLRSVYKTYIDVIHYKKTEQGR
jgi:DNA replication licensing factor MCM4